MTIYDRFKKVLEDRQENPWANALGIDRSAIRRMKEEGKAPDWSPLSAMSRAELINKTWLVDGRGAQFDVNRYVTDADCANDLGCDGKGAQHDSEQQRLQDVNSAPSAKALITST